MKEKIILNQEDIRNLIANHFSISPDCVEFVFYNYDLNLEDTEAENEINAKIEIDTRKFALINKMGYTK